MQAPTVARSPRPVAPRQGDLRGPSRRPVQCLARPAQCRPPPTAAGASAPAAPAARPRAAPVKRGHVDRLRRDSRSSPPRSRRRGRAAIAFAVSATIGTLAAGPASAADLARRRQPVELGHLHVHQDDVEVAARRRPPPPRRRSATTATLCPAGAEIGVDQVLVGRIVLGEQHAQRACRLRPRRMRAPPRRAASSAAAGAGT